MARKVSNLSLAMAITVGTAVPYAVFAEPAVTPLPSSGTSSALEQARSEALLNAAEAPEKEVVSPDVDTTSPHKQRVIVQLSRDPLAVTQYEAEQSDSTFSPQSAERSIDAQQSSFVGAAAKLGIALQVNYTYDTVLNGMEITVSSRDIPRLAEIPGVISIDANETYQEVPVEDAPLAQTDTEGYDINPLKQIGADRVWSEGLSGAGIKVGVIDTGVDYLHPDLKDAYKGGYDSFNKDNDPYEDKPSGSFSGTNHGTHVAGTIVGRNANTGGRAAQKGVAYGADLYAYKVLGYNAASNSVGGTTAQVIDGIEHAVKDGMDVINLSLGSDGQKSTTSPESVAIDNAVLKGITAVVANGNSASSSGGNYYYTMGSPASSQLAISVGAVDSPSIAYSASATASVVVSDSSSTAKTNSSAAPSSVDAPKTAEASSDRVSGPSAAEGSTSAAPSADSGTSGEKTFAPLQAGNAEAVSSAAALADPAQFAPADESAVSGGAPSDTVAEAPAAEAGDTPSAAEVSDAVDPAEAQPAGAEAGELEPAAEKAPQSGAYALKLMAWQTGRTDFAAQLGTNANSAVYANLGTADDYAALLNNGQDPAGKVVLVSRGGTSLEDKVVAAKQAGAKALVIFNGNVSASNAGQADLSTSISGRDGLIGAGGFLGEGANYIPVFDMQGSQGRALARTLTDPANAGAAFTLSFGSSYPSASQAGDHVAPFSSRGPNSDDGLSIKPDVVAPGVQITSAYPAYGGSYNSAYAQMSGTSMASPHVAGAAALLKQSHPAWSPADVRAALANTSVTVSNAGGTRYDVYSQGAGRIDVFNANSTPALLQVIEPMTLLDKNLNASQIDNYASSAAFGMMAAGSSQSKTLQLKNVSGNYAGYSASVQLNPSVTSDPGKPVATPDINKIQASLSGLNPNGVVSAAAGTASQFQLNIKVASDAPSGVYEGQVVLTATDPLSPTLHLPFVLHVGSEQPVNGFGVQQIASTRTIVTPDGDGLDDSTNVSFRLTASDTNFLQLNVIDEKGIGLGYVGQVYQNNASGGLQTLSPKVYTFNNVSDSYTTSSGVKKKLPNGIYRLQVAAVQWDANSKVVKRSDNTAIEYTIDVGYKIADGEVAKVNAAKSAFNAAAAVTNTTKIGSPALTLPVGSGLVYQVTGSNASSLIGTDGTLKALPASGSQSVTLTVAISSAQPGSSAKTTVSVPVTLTAASSSGGGASTGGGASSGGGASAGGGASSGGGASAGGGASSGGGAAAGGGASSGGGAAAGGGASSGGGAAAGGGAVSGGGTSAGGGTTGGTTGAVTPPAAPASGSALAGAVSPGGSSTALTPIVGSSAGGAAKASLDEAALRQALDSGSRTLVVEVPTTAAQSAEVSLDASQVGALKQANGATLVVSSASGAVALPSELIGGVSAGSSLLVRIAPAASKSAAFESFKNGAGVIGAPVSFEVSTTNAAGKSVSLTSTGSTFVTRSFTVPAAVSSGQAGVVYEENGTLRPIASKLERQSDGSTLVTVSRPGFSTYAVVSAPSVFKDISNSWAKDSIRNLSSKLLINGTSASTFTPKRSVTRAEFASMLVRSLGLESQNAAPFSDVKAKDWFAGDVAAAYEAGLIGGTGGGKFDPNATITREQLAVLLTNTAKLLDLNASSGSVSYADAASFAPYAKSGIAAASSFGLIQGEDRGGKTFFNPKSPATREAAATVLENLLERAGLIE
ncbi:S8 family serine peptidase [Saccharibacillus sp. CPCC 101409]|uniref:S8 family serine peptidase n=1 Tax=Saccharibacillus sp. CPCC 101409 TaxID=3058041 RepID=UPI002673F37D|nr:S8 family serine peptidase [Saccharibacillus sp. CPCC 101409]MDO3408456.1 S8 family serine peptidase [Saccharibacillus sp. CPCC 101409]